MKLSKLIKCLADFQEQHGDTEVVRVVFTSDELCVLETNPSVSHPEAKMRVIDMATGESRYI